MSRRIHIIIMTCLIASGCTITQEVEPTSVDKENELCVVENPDVREGFLAELKSALSIKSIRYKVVPETDVPEGCAWTLRYVARWSWDIALYMSYAEINVFHNGSLDGTAKYDATKGGGSPGKFIDAEPKIRELVNELFQREAGLLFGLTHG